MGRIQKLMALMLGFIFGLTIFVGCPGGGGDDDADDDGVQDNEPPEFDGLKSAESDENGNIVLSWDAASDESPPITYNIYMATESGEQNFADPLVSTTELSYSVPDLEICKEYFFVVRAIDARGNEDKNTAEKSAKPINYHCNYSAEDRLVWTFSVPWGPFNVESLTWIHDVNSDGIADVVAESFDSRANGSNPDKHLFCLSGSNGSIIWSARPTNELGYGSGGWGDKCVNRSPDLNGDGLDDVVFGSAWGDRTAYAISGEDGNVIWYFDSYVNPASPSSGWVLAIESAPDITGDGVPEVVFSFGSDNNSAYLADGTSGNRLWRLTAYDAIYSLAVLNDVNNDGVPDFAFGAGDEYDDRVICVSGASNITADVIWEKSMSTTVNFTMTSIRDINGDGANEVVTGVWSYYSTPCRIIALSGKNGSVLWSYSGLGYEPPMRLANLGDVNGDGYDDVAAASWADFIVALSGKTGDELWRASTGIAGDDVWAVDAIGDVSGDGITDVAAGSFSSLVYVINGATGDILWSYDTGDSKLFSVRGIPDVTGDCVPDVIAGTQALNVGDAGAGTVFLFNGCP